MNTTPTPDKKLTPMGELIEWLKKERKTLYEFGYDVAADRISAAIDNATFLLEAEREYASQQAPESTPPVSAMEDGWVKVEDGYPTPADGDKDGNVLGWDKFQNKCHKCSIIDIAQMKLRFTHWSTLPPPPSNR